MYSIIRGDSMWESFYDIFYKHTFIKWPFRTEKEAKEYIEKIHSK